MTVDETKLLFGLLDLKIVNHLFHYTCNHFLFIFEGSNATIEEISVEISTQECNKGTKESFDSRPNLTTEMKQIENVVVPSLKIDNQSRESQTNENPQIVLDTKHIVNDLEIHSVIKNRRIQTTV